MISLESSGIRGRMGMGRHEVTVALGALAAGDSAARDTLLELVYDELRKLAENRLRQEPAGQTLQATALVHEAYLRLVNERDGDEPGHWQGRAHFFAAAAEAMRRILIERARRRKRMRHGGGRLRVDLADADLANVHEDPAELLALDEVLTRLEREDARLAQVVSLRFFGGMAIPQVAELLGVSDRTIKRDWEFARAWLLKEMHGVQRPSFESDTSPPTDAD
ncbi:MAG TPA: ECF-type sigma factor [Phycisphaerales bacterium]|nr:ECF-type sigma factor [Phycisphaerales bacterium]